MSSQAEKWMPRMDLEMQDWSFIWGITMGLTENSEESWNMESENALSSVLH